MCFGNFKENSLIPASIHSLNFSRFSAHPEVLTKLLNRKVYVWVEYLLMLSWSNWRLRIVTDFEEIVAIFSSKFKKIFTKFFLNLSQNLLIIVDDYKWWSARDEFVIEIKWNFHQVNIQWFCQWRPQHPHLCSENISRTRTINGKSITELNWLKSQCDL